MMYKITLNENRMASTNLPMVSRKKPHKRSHKKYVVKLLKSNYINTHFIIFLFNSFEKIEIV